MEDPTLQLALVFGLGIGAQWLASVLRVPAIILLLVAGLAAGALSWVNPEEMAGDLLFPGVSVGVALLLFGGGLGLRFRELGGARSSVIRLLTVGVVVTAVLTSVAAVLLTPLPTGVAILFGAIMVVTGPTVVGPLLRQAKLRPRVSRVLNWEGIFVDPLGAVLGITVLEVLLESDGGFLDVAWQVLWGTAWGVGVGIAGAGILTLILTRHWVPDHLHNPVTIALVLGTYAASNQVLDESGLYATTVMGVVLANQRRVGVAHLREFQESIASLIIAAVFVLLAARVEIAELGDSVLPALAVLAALVLVIRPASVLLSTVGTPLSRSERRYVAGVAPRGIVAASISALFGLRLSDAGLAGGDTLAAITFLVVAGTVVIYGLSAAPLSRWLHVSTPPATGVALVGAPSWAVGLAEALVDAEVPVLMIVTDHAEAARARERGLLVYDGRLEDEGLHEALDLVGVRMAITASGSEELDAFGSDRLIHALGRANVWRLPRDAEEAEAHRAGPDSAGRQAFGGRMTQAQVADMVAGGAKFRLVTTNGAPPPEKWMPLMAMRAEDRPELVGAELTTRPGDDRILVLDRSGEQPAQ